MMFDVYTCLFLLAALTVFLVWKHKNVTYPRNLPLPPGPKPLPVVGNIFDVPKTMQWVTYRDMSAIYGDIVHLRVLGQSMIILGSPDAAFDLFERRSATYSDRGMSTMVSLTGWDWNFSLMSYGQRWRRLRRTFHQCFHAGTMPKHQPVQLHETRRFLKRLSQSPDQFVKLIRQAFGATILKIAYDINASDSGDQYIVVAEEALRTFEEVLVPGKYLVEFMPFLRFVPAWFPGAGFQIEAAKGKEAVTALREMPFATAKDAIKDGSAGPSITSVLLDKISHIDGTLAAEEEEIAKNVTGIAYAGGADTTFSAIQTFFLAMTLYPQVQKRAQAELDAIIGPCRLPEFSDRASLPYINALARECLRWQTVAPLGLPHRCLEDDEYRGYHIPKGSLVMANLWAFSRDPIMYPEPDEFKPERFLKDGQLDPQVKDPNTIAFGYGRRICPGRHFADSSLFINVASVLHVFDIESPLDSGGRPIQLEPKMTSGILSYPEKFRCTIKPRSRDAEALIHAL